MGFQYLSSHNVLVFMLFVFALRSNRKFCLVSVAGVDAAVQKMTRGNETDRLALLAIKARITDDPFQILSSWNDSIHFCLWKGVTCGRKHRRVTLLDLASRRLRGQISPWIANLSFVRVIDLSKNSLEGEIPPGVGRLFRLRNLVLGNNSLVGEIPRNLSFCSHLRVVNLVKNNLTGQIPSEIGSLSELEYISLAGNNLTGNIPPDLGNLSSLQVLDLTENSLEGNLPDSLGRLKSLYGLQISTNYLSGKIPRSIYNLSKIRNFHVAANWFEGRLPQDIGRVTLPNIERFLVWENQFSGPIPTSFSNASNLSSFQISLNRFSGGVPDIFGNLQKLGTVLIQQRNLGSGRPNDLDFFASMANCSNLKTVVILGSNFGGTFPTSFANFSTRLESLDANLNLISGNIPHGIGNLINLNSLSIGNNLLSGTIPSTIGKLDKLAMLSLTDNRFSGELPSTLGNLSSLLGIYLSGNNLQGGIPSSLGNCSYLEEINLSNNALNGTIPQSFTDLQYLSLGLDLSRNNLVGSLPSEVGKLKTLVMLDVSHNQLSGVVPQSLGDCTFLRVLYMDHNIFGGTIPESLSLLRGIEEIDLSNNILSGKIPPDIAGLVFLSQLNLSFNDLEGEVPSQGVFGNVSAISVTGNHRLCGGIPQLQLQACDEENLGKRNSFRKGKLIISIVFGILGVSFVLYLILSSWLKKKRKKQIQTSPTNPFAGVSYGDLLKATNGFSSENLIGEGGIGSVYKGILEADQTVVAVKVFNLKKRGASKSFASECETLRGVRHRNLVKIITACSSIDYQGNDFKALVYELMPNGNLESSLHPSISPQTENPIPLTLSKRIDMAMDVASAVDYLHNNVETPIVHCDLKPSNILLDQENNAHVGDFGLSRIIQLHENPEISNNQTSSTTGLKGTIGYAAPEYGMGSKVSKEGDMYSFGILLLEMFTGKRPTDNDFGDGMNLNQFVDWALPERVMEIVDQGMISMEENNESITSDDPEQGQTRKMKIRECCVSVLKIGVMCSDKNPRARMKIDEALKQLYATKKLLLLLK